MLTIMIFIHRFKTDNLHQINSMYGWLKITIYGEKLDSENGEFVTRLLYPGFEGFCEQSNDKHGGKQMQH